MFGTSRRIAKVAIATALLVAVTSATAPSPAGAAKKKKKKRVVEEQYVAATGPRGAADTPCVGEPIGCVVIPVEKGEKFVDVEVVDTAGEPVWASVYIYGYSDGSDAHEHICGESDGPLRMGPGVSELYVVLTQTTAGATSACTGPTTVGTVKATLSNRA